MEERAKEVMEKMQELYGPPRVMDQRCMDQPFVYGSCGGNHPTSQCLPKESNGQ